MDYIREALAAALCSGMGFDGEDYRPVQKVCIEWCVSHITDS